MTREQLVQALRRLARSRGVTFKVDYSKGKGSHARIRFGDRSTIVQKDLTPSRIRRILKQLDIEPGALG